jgi:hypothetical protein
MGNTNNGDMEAKLERFAALYIQHNSPADAAMQVWNCSTRAVARSLGSKYLKDSRVKAFVREALSSQLISPEWVLVKLKNIAEEGESESVQLRALELLGKYLKLFSDDVKKTNAYLNIDLTNEQAFKILRSNKDCN